MLPTLMLAGRSETDVDKWGRRGIMPDQEPISSGEEAEKGSSAPSLNKANLTAPTDTCRRTLQIQFSVANLG